MNKPVTIVPAETPLTTMTTLGGLLGVPTIEAKDVVHVLRQEIESGMFIRFDLFEDVLWRMKYNCQNVFLPQQKEEVIQLLLQGMEKYKDDQQLVGKYTESVSLVRNFY
jgi:hypothetical protein